jgi:predicted TIM-barrel fold metal-dependent hydrolase
VFIPVGLVATLGLGGALVAQQTQPPPPPPQGQQTTTPPANPAGAGQAPQGRGGRGRGNSVTIQPGEECPPGMTETRPQTCQPPLLPAPSILDYRPRSTLVTDVHMVPKAKYPAIDYHAHVSSFLGSAEALARLIPILDSLNVRMVVSADNMSGTRLATALDLVRNSPFKDRVRIQTGPNLGGVGPGWSDKAIAQLEADLKAGAVGIGEIMKGFGLSTRKADGTRLHVDDPDLDPYWDACARLNIPVFMHIAEPDQFFQPLDMHNERWLEMALDESKRRNQPGAVTFDELITERNNLLRKHPKTKFVLAHFGWQANNLAALGKVFDEFPNASAEMGAVLYDIGRQPRAAHDFFIKYQDRILFGKDAFEPSEYPYYWRVLETKDEYFDYYRDYHAFWKMYGIDLPDTVLKKVYYQNALKLTPGLPQDGWPK